MNEMPTPDPKPASSAYSGHVVHARRRPRAHRLRYRVFYLLLDLAELPRLDRDLRLFGFNRAGLFSFHERDHGPRDGIIAAQVGRCTTGRGRYRNTGWTGQSSLPATDTGLCVQSDLGLFLF